MAWFASMTFVAALSRPPLLGALLLALTWTAAGQAQQVRVCAFGFNSHDELAVLRSHLPPGEFDFVDFSADLVAAQNARSARLTAAAAAGQSVEDDAAPWLLNLCRPDLQCDITIYSGEFAGRFFGRYGSSMSLQEMEEASCQTRCQGLFHTPRRSSCSPATPWRQKIATAALRESTSRCFWTTALTALRQRTWWSCATARWDRASGNRSDGSSWECPASMDSPRSLHAESGRHLACASTSSPRAITAGYLKRAFGDTKPNKKLLAAFRGTSLVQMSGMTPSEPGAAGRDLVCGVYDDTRTVAQRLRDHSAAARA